MQDDKADFFPNAVLAGVRKCGTTSVFEWLSAHPMVGAPTAKGTEYLMDRDSPSFNPEWNYHDHGLAGYRRFFDIPSDKTVWLDATTRYLDQETALSVIAKQRPQPHVLFILREPAERLNSLFRYEQNNRRRIIPEATLNDFVRCITLNQPDELLTKSSTQPNAGRWWQELVSEFAYGHYVDYLLPWKAILPPERLHVYLFEDMKRDAQGFMKRVAQDIGIDPDFYSRCKLSIHNQTVRFRSPGIHRLVRCLKPMVPKNTLTKYLRNSYLRFQNAVRITGLQAATEDLSAVKRLFCADNERLAREFGLNLTAW